MLNSWLQKNKLLSLSEISSPEQLEPFQIFPLYTKENHRSIAVPYLPPAPHLFLGNEFFLKEKFNEQVKESLNHLASVIYLQTNIDLSTNHEADYSVLKTFLPLEFWQDAYAKYQTQNEICFYIEDANIESYIPPKTSRGFSAQAEVLAGCNKTQELAVILDHFIRAIDLKLVTSTNIGDVHFTFYNDNHFLLDIAKIRAFKFLYLQVIKEYGFKPLSPFIHVRFNPIYYSLNEVWMNLKRQGSAVFSALTTNVQSISLPAFDHRNKLNDVDGNSISRNIINILKEESHLWDVYDPAKGSYLIETLTHDLAEAAWAQLKNIDTIDIKSIAQKRLELYKNKHMDIVGTTIYQGKDFTSPLDSAYLDGGLGL